MANLKVIEHETDVLVIGGGLAGCMAAIKASEGNGLRVTLVDKSNTLASGCAASGHRSSLVLYSRDTREDGLHP